MGLLLSERWLVVIRWCYRRRRSLFCSFVAVGSLVAAILLWPMDVAHYLNTEPSAEMHDRSGRLLYAFLNPQEQWCFVRDLSDISPRLIQAVIAAEDRRFYRHWGIDPIALVRALWQNIKHRRIVSGASTLTMQVVKRADKTPRSLLGKIRQLVQSVRLEVRVSKNDILRTYLNTAPYGLNLIGCEAAARRFFGKPACELTLSEAALLAGLPKGPSAYMPSKHPAKALRRRNYILKRMLEEGFVSEKEFQRACAEPLNAGWHSFPALAPHLAMFLKSEILQQRVVCTTLDHNTQTIAEHLVRESIRQYGGEIRNAALIVVDAPSASVLARVGSANFYDEEAGGQVDSCRSARSPGSALKPFTYALAMERNCLYAGEMLLDSSLDYGLYEPENFDRRYRGLVSASCALNHSLNVPAITVLERVGYIPVHSFLRGLGLSTLVQPPEHYGLGLTLGNCEARLEELAAAYSMLANLGEYRARSIVEPTSMTAARRFLSRGICLKIYEMLEQPLPTELGSEQAQPVSAAPRVCWKTGTSTGHRDAWAFVFNRQYLVGVWMGNNDGTPSRKLVGAQAALPLAATMFRSLKPKSEPAWPEVAGDLCKIQVCAVSGLPASAYCKRTRESSLPRGQFLTRICDMHYPARDGAGQQVDCDNVIERWPGTAKGWNLARITAPLSSPVEKRAARSTQSRGLRILSPSDKGEYILTGEANGDRIALRASLDEEMPLYWYVNGRYLGTSNPRVPLIFDLKPGKHRITCMTSAGTMDHAQCEVFLPATSIRFRN